MLNLQKTKLRNKKLIINNLLILFVIFFLLYTELVIESSQIMRVVRGISGWWLGIKKLGIGN